MNVIMGAFVGAFLGHSIYVIWNFKTHPELYAIQSVPWYTSIFMCGAFTLVVLAVCIMLKVILQHYAKKSDYKPTE